MFYIILALVGTAAADYVNEGPCPNVKPMANFDLKAFEGRWYGVGMLKYYNYTVEKCTTTEYKVDGDQGTLKYWYVDNGVQMYMNGTVRYAENSKKSGSIIHSFQIGGMTSMHPSYVLATDYTNYAIVYTCVYYEYMSMKSHAKIAGISSRSMKLEGNAKKAVDDFLKKHSNIIDPTQMAYFDLSDKICSFTSSAPVQPFGSV